MTQKFCMGVPLYRQEQEWSRMGVKLSRQTMSNWLLWASKHWLSPVYEALHGHMLKRQVLHADETTLQVLCEPEKKAQAKGYMWLYLTGICDGWPIVLYEYQPNRKAEHAAKFLEGFSGYLHADGYQGYHNLPKNIRVVGCWAHARRKFDEALNAIPPDGRGNSPAGIGMKYCNALFAKEKQLASLSCIYRAARAMCTEFLSHAAGKIEPPCRRESRGDQASREPHAYTGPRAASARSFSPTLPVESTTCTNRAKPATFTENSRQVAGGNPPARRKVRQ